MRRLLTGLVGVALAIGSGPGLASDWPCFLGPNKNGSSPETGINKDWKARPPKLLWKTPMGDRGYAGPSVADGKVLIIDHKGADDVVRAVDIKTGKDVWTFSYPDARGHNYGFSRATPTVDENRVYTLSREGNLHCLKLGDGAKVWAVSLVRRFAGRLPQWRLATSPLIDGDKLIVVPGGRDACVAALDKMSGKTIWKGGGSDKPGYATPVAATLDGKKQYVVFAARNLIGVDAANGRLLWKYPWRTSYDVNAATPIVSGRGVFITSGYRHGCALLKLTGGQPKRVWENKAIQSHFSSPIAHRGYIYGTSDPGRLVCLDARTGKTQWTQRGFQKGGLVALDGVLIVVDGARGSITMCRLSPQRYQELGRITGLGGQSWTAPIVADGKLIVRNKSALACYNLK